MCIRCFSTHFQQILCAELSVNEMKTNEKFQNPKDISLQNLLKVKYTRILLHTNMSFSKLPGFYKTRNLYNIM